MFLDINPGSYTPKVTKEGFNTAEQPEFALALNQASTYDFTLSVGTVRQTVTVQATAAALQASSAELGTAIMKNDVNSLPLNGRNFTDPNFGAVSGIRNIPRQLQFSLKFYF